MVCRNMRGGKVTKFLCPEGKLVTHGREERKSRPTPSPPEIFICHKSPVHVIVFVLHENPFRGLGNGVRTNVVHNHVHIDDAESILNL